MLDGGRGDIRQHSMIVVVGHIIFILPHQKYRSKGKQRGGESGRGEREGGEGEGRKLLIQNGELAE